MNLISSYLSNRKQFVNVLDTKSDELSVEFGVPQGSVLGPLLFLLYINDICNITNKGKFVLFADDTNIFVAADSKNKVYELANEVLQAVNKYMGVNLLHINVKKCCYMYFSPSKRDNGELNADHSAGKHDRRHYTHHTIYPCTIYPLHYFKALRLTECSLTGIF